MTPPGPALPRAGSAFGALAMVDPVGRGPAAPRGRGADVSTRCGPASPTSRRRRSGSSTSSSTAGRRHVDTFDPKPALDEVRGQAAAGRELRAERATGAAFPSPFKFRKYGKSGIEVSELFPHLAETSTTSASSGRCRPTSPQPRAVAAAHELRRRAAQPAEHGLLGHLRPGHREPEPAGLRRPVPRRLPDCRSRRTGSRLPARRLPGDVHRHAAHRRPSSSIEHHPEPLRSRPGDQRRQLDLLAGTQPRAPGPRGERTRRSRRASSRSSWPSGCRLEATDAFDSPQSRSTSATCTARARRREQLPDGPAAARAGRAVRAGLARGRAAVGRPRRTSTPTTASSPRSATRPIAALLTDLKQRGCSTTRSSSGAASSAGRRRSNPTRANRTAATTTTTASRCGWPAAA